MIRRFGLRDFKLFKQLQARGVTFDLRRRLLYARSPLFSAILGLVTNAQFGSITCVLKSGEYAGLVNVVPRRHMPYWDLAFIAPALDVGPDASAIWSKLLTHLSIMGAQNGIARIYARAAEDPDMEEVLHQAGYSVVSRAEIFVLVNRPSPILAPRGLHRLEPQDTVSLLRLYHDVVPALVQQAEGMTPRWAMLPRPQMGLDWSSREYVWAEKNRANAYLGLVATSRASWLEIVVRPEYRAEVLPLIKHVLSESNRMDMTPVYCQIPDYSVGVGWVLRALGFESYARQVTMVEHTMARVPARQRILVAGLEKGVEMGAPARPVFRSVYPRHAHPLSQHREN